MRRIAALALVFCAVSTFAEEAPRPRARDVGVVTGILPTGALNAITDVAGVRVGHTTVRREPTVRTGVTVVLPHGGNLFREKVPAAVFVGNGFGKLMGSTQIEELGELESPIFLTSTLNVPRVADAAMDWMLALPGNEEVRSINIVVGETNDGRLNDIRGRHVGREEVFAALRSAASGAVAEGSVGAGTGTVAFEWKGGIGTASRKLPASLGGWTVGVLVQSNYGGVLTIAGAPVGRELGKYYLKDVVESIPSAAGTSNIRNGVAQTILSVPVHADRSNVPVHADGSHVPGSAQTGLSVPHTASPEPRCASTLPQEHGSIMIVIATDAPIDARNLRRLAARSMWGLARTGAAGTNGSGDYAIAFSTARNATTLVRNDDISPLFLATIEATEEAIYNSLFRATSVGNVEALPVERVREVLRKYGAM